MSTKRFRGSVTLAAYVFAAASLLMTLSGCNGDSSGTGSDGGGVDATADNHVGTDSGKDSTSPTDGSSCPTGQASCGNKCVTLSSDPTNCGTCGSTCGTGLVCSNGTCSLNCGDGGGLTQCGSGCYDLQTDSNNCGACSTMCALGQICAAGSCKQSCGTGSQLCGSQCVDTQTDNANCGGCSTACVAGTVCSGGSCQTTCGGGLTQCGGGGDAGSQCKDVQVDVNNCGSCGNVCAVNSVCSAGKCVGSCVPPLVDCAGGCIDPTTSDKYCGASGACGVGGSGSAGTSCATGLTCANSVCSIICTPGQVECGGTCIDPTSNNTYCGASGPSCTGATPCGTGTVCTGGVCKSSCNPGQVVCGGSCIDPKTNLTYCGAIVGSNCTGAPNAGTTCPPGDVCSGGTCQLTCSPGLVNCGQKCIDPSSNTTYCGASGNCSAGDQGATCLSGYVCSQGACTLQCQANLVNCNGVCINPVTDPNYCNANSTCSNCLTNQCVCPSGDVCTGGTTGTSPPGSSCQLSCKSTEVDCGGVCIDPTTDSFYCGATPGGTCNDPAGPGAGHPNYEGKNCSTTAGSTCTSPGVCTCPGSDVVCNSACINPNTDNVHCGASGACGVGGSGSAGTPCTAAGTTCGVLPGNTTATCNCPTGEVVCNVAGTPTCINPNTDNAYCGANAACAGYTNCGGIAGANCGVVPPATTGTCNCPGADVDCDVGGAQTCIDPTISNTNCGATPPSGPGTGLCTAGAASGSPNYPGQVCGPLTQCGPGTGSGPPMCYSTCTGGGTQCFPTPPAVPYCANTTSDNSNCGTCGTVCPALTSCGIQGGVGACISTCTAGQTACPASSAPNPTTPYCANESNDSNNCGGCGNAFKCTAPLLCSNSHCVSSCTAPDNTFCPNPSPGHCADTTSDNANCGSCGAVCGTNNCLSSVCCPAGATTVCNGSCSNPNTDPNHCGGCPGAVCSGGTPFCVTGVCTANKVVFVTSATYNGNLGGLAGADAKCQGLASAAGLPGTYLAWLADASNSPSTRMTQPTVDYILPDGTLVAHGWAGLTSGTLLHALDENESGGTPGKNQPAGFCGEPSTATMVWDNVLSNGSAWVTTGTSTCGDWTDSSDGAVWGEDIFTNSDWTAYCSGGTCAWTCPIYCVEQ